MILSRKSRRDGIQATARLHRTRWFCVSEQKSPLGASSEREALGSTVLLRVSEVHEEVTERAG